MSGRFIRAMTPKEFAEAIGGLLHPNTVRDRCKRGEIQTIGGPGRPPYLIPPTALEPYRLELSRFLLTQ
jgi:hypothetical protein